MVKVTALKGATKKKLTGIAFVLPCTIILILMMAFPVIQTFVFSFANIKLPNFEMSFSGFDNFVKAFSKPEVSMIIRNTVIWTIISVFLRLLLGLGSALIMNANVKGIVTLRVVALLPWTVPMIVSSNTWRWILQSENGVVNGTLRAMGLGQYAQTWLGNVSTALPSILLANSWVGFPFVMMMLLSAMQGLSRELYEAAEIDGANGFHLFRYITFPGIKPVLYVVLALESISAINAFDMIFVMTGGGPGGATEIFGLFIYRLAFGGSFDFGSASAVSVVLITIAVLGFSLYGFAESAGKRRGEA